MPPLTAPFLTLNWNVHSVTVPASPLLSTVLCKQQITASSPPALTNSPEVTRQLERKKKATGIFHCLKLIAHNTVCCESTGFVSK